MALINDFLDFARMEDAAHKMERSPTDLGELIAEIVDEFKPLMESTGQRISVAVENDSVVLGDRRRLQQVVGNLVANAIKFTDQAATSRWGAELMCSGAR